MTTSNIVAGFRTTGIYPLDRDAIQLLGECKMADKLITPNVSFIKKGTASSNKNLRSGIYMCVNYCT